MQELNPGSQTPNRQQTEYPLKNRMSYRGSSLKNLNSTARPYDQRTFSPLDPTASWLSHLALVIYMFVVNFDALAQASDIQIERRPVVFLCWMQDLNPGSQTPKPPADWIPADKPTELSRIKLKTWTRQPVPMISEQLAHYILHTKAPYLDILLNISTHCFSHPAKEIKTTINFDSCIFDKEKTKEKRKTLLYNTKLADQLFKTLFLKTMLLGTSWNLLYLVCLS